MRELHRVRPVTAQSEGPSDDRGAFVFPAPVSSPSQPGPVTPGLHHPRAPSPAGRQAVACWYRSETRPSKVMLYDVPGVSPPSS